jgi:LysM repeat protein
MAALVTAPNRPVAIYLSYNNQQEGFMLPVLPSSLEISTGGDEAEYSTSLGEIQVIKHPKLTEYKFESLFPYYDYPFIAPLEAAGGFSAYFPMEYVNLLDKWMHRGKPIRFVYVGTGFAINEAVSISSFNWKEVAGTPGDIEYDLTLKRYVFYGAQLTKLDTKTGTAKSTKAKARPGKETPATYMTKPGDTFFKISKQFQVTVTDLQKLNRISDAEAMKLAVGRKIRLK